MKALHLSRVSPMVFKNLSYPLMAIKGKTVYVLILLLMLVLSPGFLVAADASGSDVDPGQDAARSGEERFWVTPFAGAVFFGSLNPQPNTGFYEDISRPSGVLIGLRGSVFLTSFLAAELSISRSSTENVHELLYYDPDQPVGNPTFGTQTLRNSVNPIVRLGGNLLYQPPISGPIVPHLSAGLGWVHYSPRKEVAVAVVVPLEDGTVFSDTIQVPVENVRLDSQNSLSIDLGAGLSSRITQVLSARIDLVFHFSKFLPLDVDGPLTGEVFYAESQWVSDLELSTGLVFRF